jgi:hypothetical protein
MDNEAVWFPGDPVCVMQHAPEWVERHRRIARKVKPGAGMFTRRMLEQDCRITRGIKGIDPERPRKDWPAMAARWLKEHPAITPEEREVMRDRGKSLVRPFKTPQTSKPTELQIKKGIQIPPGPEGA